MISLLIGLLILCVVLWIAVLIVRAMPIPTPFGNIAIAIIGLIGLLILLERVGLFSFGHV